MVMEANRGWFGKIGPRGGLMGHGSVVGGSWQCGGWIMVVGTRLVGCSVFFVLEGVESVRV